MADPWALPTDVAEIAGATVTEADVVKAQTLIETVVGRTSEATARISSSDQTWLKRAVAYQAAWMQDQPDLFTRTDVSGSSQDGASQQFRKDSHTIAPMAKTALKKVSWLRSRSLKVGTRVTRGYLDPAGAWVAAVFDEGHERWVREEV